MKSKLKQLGKDSIIYGVGGVAAKAITFFLLPIYTRLFTPTEYGIIEMLTVLSSFLGTLLTMGMDSAQSFYFFQQKDKGKQAQAELITAILQWRLIWGTVIVGAALLIAPFLNQFFFEGQLTWHYFALAFCGCLFGRLMSQSVEVFRLLYRPWNYLGITLSVTVISDTLGIFLVLFLDWGIVAFLVASAIASILGTILGWRGIRAYIDWSKWHRQWWPKLLRFGAPLVPAGLGMYVLNTSDRWFIIHYQGQDALGLYAVGVKFAMIIALAVTTFRQAWWPIAMDALHTEEGPELFRTIARLYLGLGTAAIVVMTAISPFLVRWLTSPGYYSAYPIVGILAWSSLFYGFYLIGCAGIWKKEKTAWNPLLMGFAALLNIALDYIFVPRWGITGAAIATSTSFLVWNAIALVVSEKLWQIHYPIGALLLQIFTGIFTTTAILLLYNKNASLTPIISVVIMGLIILISTSLNRNA
ncbi:lipopolysaccharide biosynthesis protein [Oxynema aestuarii]|uniref:Oligosaccharide flippase family protein n=1 Tax=Oxynema aestuarii AP17 TaxID=2064643 RepID=A0A6H1TRY8_9CYAN|nr:oligosaccharide flippase family protein [Oxynema aestuarii]QIZ69368.1 oligosaccharide flippase family protein [Oxynema aestuarii AP17]